eukprot:450943-Rhodomonas_salina.1
MPQTCGVVMAEEPGGGRSPTGEVEGGSCWSCLGWRQLDSLGLRWQAMRIPITSDVQTLDAHTSEKGPGELRRTGWLVSCVSTGMINTELQNWTNSECALREQCVFLLSRVEGWIGTLGNPGGGPNKPNSKTDN